MYTLPLFDILALAFGGLIVGQLLFRAFRLIVWLAALVVAAIAIHYAVVHDPAELTGAIQLGQHWLHAGAVWLNTRLNQLVAHLPRILR